MTRMLHTWTSRVATDSADQHNNGVCWSNHDGSPVGSDLSPDADGVYPNPPRIIVDLSLMGSIALGRQLPMDANYRVTGLKIGVQNVDTVGDDNDRSAFFSGYINYYAPTVHRMNAMIGARALEKMSEKLDMDMGASLWPPQQRAYQGFRFNWNRDDDVKFATNAEQVPDWATYTGLQEWAMSTIFGQWGNNLQQANHQLYSLWDSRTGATNKLRWACDIANASHTEQSVFDTSGGTPNILGQDNFLTEYAQINDYEYRTPTGTHLEIMGGLLIIEVRQCNTLPNGDISPDDYDFTVQIECEGWKRW